ncbi:MAG: DUF2059 domain-containing protein [Verrucomicrobiaceae bacterium]|jgi:hypothetical protein|nr:DUF2059 domain-containing protein [Verrucomicrobiaceae bacterium]
MKSLLTAALFLCLLGNCLAELTPSHKAAIEKLLDIMQVQKQMEQSMRAGLEAGMGTSADQIKALPQEQQDKFNNAMKRVMDALMEEMSWEKLKPDLVEVYGRNFTEKETNDVIALMQSPTGQMLVTKQAAMVGDVMKVTQERMKTFMPKIMAIMQEEMRK